MNDRTEEKKERREDASRPASYGGFLARQSYEKRVKNPLQISALVAVFLLLFLLSVVGLVALFRGGLFSGKETDEQTSRGAVTIPVLKNKELTPEEAVAAAEETLITVEVTSDTGVARGTGFIVDAEGYAVCHRSLFETEPISVTAFTNDGSAVTAEAAGSIPSLGVVILRLDQRYSYQSIALVGSNIRRGQKLYGVSSVSRGAFYGIVQAGTAVSTAENVTVTVDSEERSIPILYTSISYDSTLDGALAINENGNAAGFLTSTLRGRGGGMTAVPIITLVGLVNEITH